MLLVRLQCQRSRTDLGSARQLKEQSDARCEELKQELQLLEEKYTEETRKVRMLQERMIEWKRKRGDSSPLHPGSLNLERDPERLHSAPPSSPMHCNSPAIARPTTPLQQRGGAASIGHSQPLTEASSQRRQSFPSLSDKFSSASVQRFGSSCFQSPSSAGSMASRHGTPSHHSSAWGAPGLSFGGAFSAGVRR